ncbi:MAG: DUF4197 domain-containing protein [Candidatus Acidiferrum sp.]
MGNLVLHTYTAPKRNARAKPQSTRDRAHFAPNQVQLSKLRSARGVTMRNILIIRWIIFGSVLSLLTMPVRGQATELSERLVMGNQGILSDSKIASGLKEALQVGATNAVNLTGKRDGYFGNQVIKILMPKSLRPFERGLRAMGYGPKVDDFILSMNRSAEAAAPAAKKIFIDAILSMSFDDARKILSGGDTAATDYFKSKTTEQLTIAFRPVVEKTMDQNNVTQQYKQLVGQAQSIPFIKSPNLDITNYVVSQALNGLFYMLGQEERKIRKDPAAQTTNLLKQVFGR